MFNVEVHATSHIGRVRKGNEDNYLLLAITEERAWTGSQSDDEFIIETQTIAVDDGGVVMAVSDGMGGAMAGEVASTMAVETVGEKLLEDLAPGIERAADEHLLIHKLHEATVFANHLIHQQGRSDPQFQGMGATFTGIGVTPGAADIIQVGDSRAYLIRKGEIYQVTKDQSLVQQLIDANQISEAEAEKHTLKNVILQALGAQNEIYPVSARIEPRRDDIFVLCSDGLSNKVGAGEMRDVILSHVDELQSACADLVKLANANGGEDNITVVLAKFTGDGLPEAVEGDLKMELIDIDGIHDTADQDTADLNTTEAA